jgi:hypothetical protein
MSSDSEGRLRDEALAYEAPFLIEKLLKDHVADTAEEAQILFTEVKRYLVACYSGEDRTRLWEMYSLRIDEVWHQFVLFTREYVAFCERYFGRYVHHNPSNAPKYETDEQWPEPLSFEEFVPSYEAFFGVPVPDCWYDEKTVTPARRITHETTGSMTTRAQGGTVDLLGPEGDVLLSVNDLARPALEFVARTPVFYVRELPGGLADEEKVSLVATLVEFRLLRLAI